MNKITHGSLFSGIGGPEIAAERLNWENVFHCEKDEFCRTVLKYHFPQSKSYEDIFDTDFTIWRNRIFVLSGGFPCQPFSQAGKGEGEKDSRYLWPQMLRAVREIQPPFVVAENVHGILTRNKGVWFEEICAELETEGYEVQPFLLPIAGVGHNHKRNRFFFVAYNDSYGRKTISSEFRSEFEKTKNTKRSRKESKWKSQKSNELGPGSNVFLQFEKSTGQPAVFALDDEFSIDLDGISFPKFIQKTLKAGGNSICPDVIEPIFQVINRMIEEL